MWLSRYRALFILAGLVAAVSYFTRPVFPENATSPVFKAAICLYFRLGSSLGQVAEAVGFDSISVFRGIMRMLFYFTPAAEDIEEYTTTMDGVEVMVFTPKGSSGGLRPGLVHYHGGGWVILTPVSFRYVCRILVEHTQSVVVSVNYRRAPEFIFPAAFEDSLKATKYFLRNAAKYGVDKDKIGLRGDSAGGNLAVAVALNLTKERDSELPTIKYLSPENPALQVFDFNLPSYIKYEKGPGFLDKTSMIAFWLLYGFGNQNYFADFYANNHISVKLREKHSKLVDPSLLPLEMQDVDAKNFPERENAELATKVENLLMNPAFAPLMAPDEDLTLLPPTYIMTAEIDPLRDEGFILVERLRRVGVPVEHSHMENEMHAVLSLVHLDGSTIPEYAKFGKFVEKVTDT